MISCVPGNIALGLLVGLQAGDGLSSNKDTGLGPKFNSYLSRFPVSPLVISQKEEHCISIMGLLRYL